MSLLLDGIISGILTGGVYALMASGLTLVFGVLEIINVAQGSLIVAGAFLSYALLTYLHINIFLGLILTMPFMFLVGYVVDRVFVRRLRVDRVMMSIMVTYGVALVIDGILTMIFSTSYVHLQTAALNQSFPLAGMRVPMIYVYVFLMSVVFLLALYALLYRTTFGQALRATAQNRNAARLIGIDVDQMSSITFGICAALAAAGGMGYGAISSFHPNSQFDLISRVLVIIVLGGMGNIGGALVASLLMLVIEDVVSTVWLPNWSTLIFFIVLAMTLALRPQGLFGSKEARQQ
ncbi:MAG: branched-chain amino acid ABC transporter permease [Firmicutes bacterium]|nr:branched-chain amino acid ABC transporter permease [Bacillota bacterium]